MWKRNNIGHKVYQWVHRRKNQKQGITAMQYNIENHTLKPKGRSAPDATEMIKHRKSRE